MGVLRQIAEKTGMRPIQVLAKLRDGITPAQLLTDNGIDVNTFIFVVIEKAPPYGIGIYELSAEDRQWGREMYQRDLRVFDRCMKEQQWPGYPQEIRMIDLPRYARTSKIY